MKPEWDVLVIGAGPAGSTAAALLADRGHRVLVVEKETFPRFRIGESLLPACLPVLERLEIETVEDTFVYKRGAQFVCEDTNRSQTFAFLEALDGSPPHAWHVERSQFDTRLRDRAIAGGAEVVHGNAVSSVAIESDHVAIEYGGQRATGRFLIDASGQFRVLARRMDGIRPFTHFGTASIFTHFENAHGASELAPENDIRIMIRPEGWGWIIPLPNHRLSVGIVSQEKVTAETLDQGLLAGPLVTRLTKDATRLATQTVSNFSFENVRPRGARFGTTGDAACFLDPVFSSGVTLALRGAESLADTLAPALEQGAEDAPDLLRDHEEMMDRGYQTFAALIDRFYNKNFAESYFLRQPLGYEMQRGVMSVLAGHVWRTDNPFQEMLLRARPSRDASRGAPG